MKFQFKFLLANGTFERWTFTAAEYRFAFDAAFNWSLTAYASGELYDFVYEA